MKVAIIGSANKSKVEIPKDFIIWGFNHLVFTDADTWFDIHKHVPNLSIKGRYFNFLNILEEKVYLAFPREDLPYAQQFLIRYKYG